MTVYAVVMVLALFVGLLSSFLWVDAPGLKLVAMGAVALGFWTFLYKYFFYNYREVSQSWLAYETICGRDRSYSEAQQLARDRRWGVRKLAGLDVAMATLTSRFGRGGKGPVQKILSLMVAVLTEVWNLVNHYMLPAIAIDDLTLTDGVKTMKSLRNQVPETLMGVGIDLVGRLVVTRRRCLRRGRC